MSIRLTSSKTPGGKPFLHVVLSEDVTPANAEALSSSMSPGGPHEGLALLAMVEDGAKFSAEARQAFTRNSTPGQAVNPVAVVVKSAPLRVMLTFVVKIAGASAATRFFGGEGDALAWLELQLA